MAIPEPDREKYGHMPERLYWEMLEGEDPDDRAIREAHGIGYEEPVEGTTCHNGCGLSYAEISAGKTRECSATAEDDDLGYPCCGGYREHRYRCQNRVWPATATPEIRRTAVRGDCIGPAHAQIEDLLLHGLDYPQRKRLTEILAHIWDDGHNWGSAHADDGPIAEGVVRDG